MIDGTKGHRLPPGVVAVPALAWMWTEAARAFLALSHHLPPGSAVDMSVGETSSIALTRNFLVQRFLDNSRLRWILFIDSDMVPPPHTAVQLLSRNRPVVGAACFQRRSPFLLAAEAFDPILPEHRPEPGLCEMMRIGFGAVLIRRAVLEAMQPPWFEHPTTPGIGEDSYFCDKLRASGTRIYLDHAICVGHMAALSVGVDLAKAWHESEPGKRALADARSVQLPSWVGHPGVEAHA